MRIVEPKDFSEINAWRGGRHAPILDEDLYPPIGMIVPGLAAGFLLTTDANVAFLEHFVSNPEAYIDDRRMAIKEIALTLERYAREKGIRRLVAITVSEPIVEAATALGYESAGQCFMMAKEVGYGPG